MADGQEVAGEELGVHAVGVDEGFPDDLCVVGVAGVGDEREELVGLGVFVQGGEVVVAEEDRDGAGCQRLGQMFQTERAELRGVFDIDKGVDSVDIADELLLFWSEGGVLVDHAVLQLFFPELQELYVFVVLGNTGHCLVGLTRWRGNPSVDQWDSERTVQFEIVRFEKRPNCVRRFLQRLARVAFSWLEYVPVSDAG